VESPMQRRRIWCASVRVCGRARYYQPLLVFSK
jgi:hypothetical protein